MTIEAPTAEQIACHYTSALDSVRLINKLVDKETRTATEVDTIERNVQHLKLMVAKDFWTTEDVTPFIDAIAAGNTI
jgi:hypothetical protein